MSNLYTDLADRFASAFWAVVCTIVLVVALLGFRCFWSWVLAPAPEPLPLQPYHVQVISPTGEVKASWNIESKGVPKVLYSFLGDSRIVDPGATRRFHWWEDQITAPQGWLLLVLEGHR
jgi:hypothetical protein